MKTRDSEAAPSPQSEEGSAKILTLTEPIKWGSGEDEEIISRLEFGELRARDLEDLSLPFSIGDYIRMASRVTGVPYQALMKMGPVDSLLVTTLMDRFFGRGPETGSS